MYYTLCTPLPSPPGETILGRKLSEPEIFLQGKKDHSRFVMLRTLGAGSSFAAIHTLEDRGEIAESGWSDGIAESG
jgi:hypothetical protein